MPMLDSGTSGTFSIVWAPPFAELRGLRVGGSEGRNSSLAKDFAYSASPNSVLLKSKNVNLSARSSLK